MELRALKPRCYLKNKESFVIKLISPKRGTSVVLLRACGVSDATMNTMRSILLEDI